MSRPRSIVTKIIHNLREPLNSPPGLIQSRLRADTCPPPGVVANLPDIIYFRANVTFSDSVAIQDADVASFTIATLVPDEPGQCPCGIDEVKSQRMGSPQGRYLQIHAIFQSLPVETAHSKSTPKQHSQLTKVYSGFWFVSLGACAQSQILETSTD